MKKKLLAIGLCLSMTAAMTGCGGSDSGGGELAAGGAYKGQELNLFLWPEYIPDDVIGDFEKQYGVTVNVSTFSSNEEMLSKFQNSADGTYDILNPSDYMVEYMIGEGLLAELDKEKLTNYGNLDEQYLGQFFDVDNTYSVPFAPGEFIVGYDSSVYPDGISSLSDLLDSKYENSIVVPDDTKILIGLINKSLGYSLNESDPANLEKTREALMNFKSNIYTLKFEGTQEVLVSGESPMVYTFNGSVAGACMETDGQVKAFFPEEGSYKWIDTLCIPANSEKQDLANEFINYILDAEVDCQIRTEIPSTSPNKAGWELVDDTMKESALTIDATSWNNSEYAMNLDDDINSLYNDMYAEFTK